MESHSLPATLRLPLLSGESVVFALRAEELHLLLTNRRVILHGQEKRLGLIAGASATKAAFVSDIDVVAVTARYAPDWVAVLGALLVLYALFGASGAVQLLLLLGGVALVAGWYFWRREVLQLWVTGSPQIAIPVSGFGSTSTHEIDKFIRAFFDIRAGLSPRPT